MYVIYISLFKNWYIIVCFIKIDIFASVISNDHVRTPLIIIVMFHNQSI